MNFPFFSFSSFEILVIPAYSLEAFFNPNIWFSVFFVVFSIHNCQTLQIYKLQISTSFLHSLVSSFSLHFRVHRFILEIFISSSTLLFHSFSFKLFTMMLSSVHNSLIFSSLLLIFLLFFLFLIYPFSFLITILQIIVSSILNTITLPLHY